MIRLKMCFLLVILLSPLYGEEIALLANWQVEKDMPALFENVRNRSNMRFIHYPSFSFYLSPKVKKIVVFNPYVPIRVLSQWPKEKLVLFVWEPETLSKDYYDSFSKVYTWDDTLVDGKKFFRFYYPHLLPMEEGLPSFRERKLCTLISRNWQPHRMQILSFFETKSKGEFEFYGWRAPQNYLHSAMYKGPIGGSYAGEDKISVLKQYRFCFCFENSVNLKGYITEKIFSCFSAGCIPIYWGATNIEEYIPKNCFIDYRNFHANEELYQFLKTMPEKVYETYLDSIRHFLKSEKAQLFSPQYGAHIFAEATS